MEHGTVPGAVPEQILTEARVVGLRNFRTPSLEAVDRRRIQLWALTAILLVSVSAGVALLSVMPADTPFPTTLGVGVVVLSIGFCAYAIEKERHLQRLAKLLTDERVLTAALSNRLRELSLLLEAGKAMNAVLELDSVLDVILRSSLELLRGTSGSIMLVDGGELVAQCVQNNPDAVGRRVRIGEGIAGRVASSREPHADPRDADAAGVPRPRRAGPFGRQRDVGPARQPRPGAGCAEPERRRGSHLLRIRSASPQPVRGAGGGRDRQRPAVRRGADARGGARRARPPEVRLPQPCHPRDADPADGRARGRPDRTPGRPEARAARPDRRAARDHRAQREAPGFDGGRDAHGRPARSGRLGRHLAGGRAGRGRPDRRARLRRHRPAGRVRWRGRAHRGRGPGGAAEDPRQSAGQRAQVRRAARPRHP